MMRNFRPLKMCIRDRENILLIWIQRPNAVLAADYDSWKKVDRYVRRGSRGIGIFPSRALKSHLRYVFDFKDTGGRSRKLTWDLEGSHLKEYLDYLVAVSYTHLDVYKRQPCG